MCSSMGTASGTSNAAAKYGESSKYVDKEDFKEFQKANFDEMKALHKQGGMAAVKEAYYDTRQLTEQKAAQELTQEQAVNIARDSIPQNVSDGWFREANSDYKPKLVQSIMQNPGTMNAGWNIAYQNYVQSLPSGSKPVSFEKWLNTPQTFYRGTNGQQTVKSDVFSAYTPNRKIAEKFGSNITTIKIKPIDTWGSYQTTGEQEILVPAKKLKR